MAKRRFLVALVLGTTFLGSFAALADAPMQAQTTHARKKKRAKPVPKASDKCTTDADCAFTAYADGACCPMLCPERAVAKSSADAIEKFAAACKKPEGGCPAPACAPPRFVTQPACVSGKCVARAAPTPSRE